MFLQLVNFNGKLRNYWALSKAYRCLVLPDKCQSLSCYMMMQLWFSIYGTDHSIKRLKLASITFSDLKKGEFNSKSEV